MLTADYSNLIIHSDASISDIIAMHDELRELESSDDGMLAPVVHTYKQLPLGGGGYFPAVEFINGWTFQFPVGNWYVRGGNLTATINPVAGCFVERTQSAAYAVSSALGGTTGPTVEEIAQAAATEVWRHTTGAAVAVKLAEAWGRLGLDASKPLTTNQTTITFGDIVMALSGDSSETIVTRQ